MHVWNLMRASAGKSCIVSIAAALATGSAMAMMGVILPDNGIDNPGSLPLTQTREGIQHATALLQHQPTQAADTNGSAWFRSPSVFTEYTYTDSRDRRLGGYTSHMRDAVAGLDFLTVGDVAVSLIGRYDHTASDTRYYTAHLSGNADNDGLTLTAAKNFDWFLVGASASYNGGDAHIRTPLNQFADITINAAGTTLAPFIGATYTHDNLTLATLPTYLYNWNWQDYDSTIRHSSVDDHLFQEAFIWVNTASYQVTDKLTVGVEADWNRITHTKKARALEDEVFQYAPGDREWLTVGPNVAYRFTPALSVYASCTKALCSGTFDTVQATLGARYVF